jgi:hypothetical protein
MKFDDYYDIVENQPTILSVVAFGETHSGKLLVVMSQEDFTPHTIYHAIHQ